MYNIKQAIIMAAGFGTRMLPLTENIPKPIADIGKGSLIENILNNLYKIDFDKIIINTHYLSEKLKNHVSSLDVSNKLEIIFSHEENILGSGGGVLNTLKYFDNKPFYRINSDIFWYDNDIFKIIEKNWNIGYEALLAVKKKNSVIGYKGNGDFNLVDNKYLKLNSENNYVFCGIGIFSPKIFENFNQVKFDIFKDFIFKYKLGKENILSNIYGVELTQDIYHIDNINNIEMIKQILIKN